VGLLQPLFGNISPPNGAGSRADQQWLEEKCRRIALAEENLEIRTREILVAALA
jgi:hypothetical protein